MNTGITVRNIRTRTEVYLLGNMETGEHIINLAGGRVEIIGKRCELNTFIYTTPRAPPWNAYIFTGTDSFKGPMISALILIEVKSKKDSRDVVSYLISNGFTLEKGLSRAMYNFMPNSLYSVLTAPAWRLNYRTVSHQLYVNARSIGAIKITP